MAIEIVQLIANGTYDALDLGMFDATADKVLTNLVRADDYPLETGVTEILRPQIVAAVYECAHSGIRDATTLERQVTERFWKPSTGRFSS